MQPKPTASTPEPSKAIRPRLREAPTHHDVDAWPISVSIHPQETLLSWWARLGDRYGLTPSALFRELGVEMGHYRVNPVEHALASPNTEVSRRTGFGDVERAARLQRTHAVVRRTNTFGMRGFSNVPAVLPMPGSRFCPLCLGTSGYWRDSWRDPLTVACVTHGVLLVATCSACGQQPFATGAWAMHRRSANLCPENVPSESRRSRTRHKPCGHDLAAVETQMADPGVLMAVELFSRDFGNPQDPVQMAGLPVTREEASEAQLLLTLDLIGRHSKPPPRDHVGSALRIAHQVLSAPTLAEAADLAKTNRLLDPFSLRSGTPIVFRTQHHSTRIQPILQAISITSVCDQLPVTTQLTYRIGSSWPRHPQGPGYPKTEPPARIAQWTAPPISFRSVPQLWWSSSVAADGAECSDAERFATSLAICAVGRSMTLAAMSERLGSSKAAARRTTSVWRQLAEGSGWPQLRQSFVEMSELARDAPVKSRVVV